MAIPACPDPASKRASISAKYSRVYGSTDTYTDDHTRTNLMKDFRQIIKSTGLMISDCFSL